MAAPDACCTGQSAANSQDQSCLGASEGPSTAVTWEFVGDRQGDYDKVEQYSFVGDGGGSFVKDENVQYYGCRIRPCCVGILLCLLIALMVFFLIMWLAPIAAATTVTTTQILIITSAPKVEMTTTSALYDCKEDFTDCYQCLRLHWSYSKRRWCCKNLNVACPTTPTPISFNCNAGLANWLQDWSEEKKQWCCAKVGRGCTTTPCPKR